MIPKGWRTYKLGEIAEIIGGGTPSTAIEEYWNGTIPWLTPRDLTNYNFKYISKGERSITERGLNNSSTRMLPEGAVLLTSRAPIGYLAIAENPICTNQGFKSLISDDTKVDNQFLYYLLKNNVEQIKSFGTGTTFAEVSGSTLKGIEFDFPENKSEQSRIAFILSSLDDKIELNLNMSKNLEAIAQAIFKEWFVDFKFPGFDGELVDGLPKGWKEGTLGDIIIYKNGKTSPERDDKGDYPVYGANGIIGYSDNYNAECNVTVIGRVGSFCGSTYFSQTRSWITDNAIVASPKTSSSTFTFIRLKSLNLNSFRGGSGQPLINQTVLSGIKTKIPDDSFLNLFEDNLLPIYKKIEFNEKQNLTLAILRDTLLPKLMTGKIKVQ